MELFAFFASFLEELIAPIPSPFVMTIAGTMAAAQSLPLWYLLIIAIIASTGKTLASIILYVVADKGEDIVLGRLGRYIGVTHKQVEAVGARFSGRRRDYLTLFLIRAAPIIPSAPISLICGLLAIPKKMYIITTYFGTIVRDFAYLYIGYAGIQTAEVFIKGVEGVSSIVTLIMAAAAVALLVWILYRKYRKPHTLDLKKDTRPVKKKK